MVYVLYVSFVFGNFSWHRFFEKREVMHYAENTTVSPEKSRMEIEKILVRYGASGFAYGWETNAAMIMFIMKNRHVRFRLPIPTAKDPQVFKNKAGHCVDPNQIKSRIEKLTRQRWRALALAVKAKLESVESGITNFEEEFLAHIVLPNGQTVGTELRPKLEEAYSSGRMPTLLLGAGN